MTTLRLPSPTSTGLSSKSSRKSFYLPLTSHGLPKKPRDASPARPHRFSKRGVISPPLSPRSPGPRSPPMSARSFGTFIDSEPSTPAYSPRMEDAWDSSTLVVLRPMSSSSAPSTPAEPTWDMVTSATKSTTYNTQGPTTKTPEISTQTSLASHPFARANTSPEVIRSKKVLNINIVRPNKIAEISQEEVQMPVEESVDDGTTKPSEEQTAQPNAAPFGKLATRMKSLLRRRTTGDKKKEKKPKESLPEIDRMEDVHWTEM
ncbi:hypothetical protein P153DRAFT_376853 [Dothidotthia symphoricarpi CBS 119687]|uniref:Uncharacterized protein n=1 Tax=Dothidotthia symphoricarpi CBS 119687 TaxID=1392245 RepID=A0A6A6A9Q2_9PLEO|nr:uncharacterized protein P153DRAFT_376853 [Dothidotthia symphoricarpi CBS 119687]KAF2127923.1 hypothetical protein P153DRAFT_376853 [Dothidotthia symphoricarpi CBS 119687]